MNPATLTGPRARLLKRTAPFDRENNNDLLTSHLIDAIEEAAVAGERRANAMKVNAVREFIRLHGVTTDRDLILIEQVVLNLDRLIEDIMGDALLDPDSPR